MYYQRGLDFRGDLTLSERLTRSEAQQLFSYFGRKALYIRNVYDFDCREETEFWYVVRDRALEIEEYATRKDRQQVRRSLRAYEFRRIDVDEMRRVGYRVFYENWLRFPEDKRPPLDTEAQFQQFLDEQAARGVEFWGGYSRETGEMAMWESVYVVRLMAVEERERLSYRYKNHYPTSGLNHVLANYYIRERGMRYVVGGARSVTEHSNVQHFLIDKMLFRKAYCRLQLVCRFPYNLVIAVFYPFRYFLPRRSKLGLLLALKSFTQGK